MTAPTRARVGLAGWLVGLVAAAGLLVLAIPHPSDIVAPSRPGPSLSNTATATLHLSWPEGRRFNQAWFRSNDVTFYYTVSGTRSNVSREVMPAKSGDGKRREWLQRLPVPLRATITLVFTTHQQLLITCAIDRTDGIQPDHDQSAGKVTCKSP